MEKRKKTPTVRRVMIVDDEPAVQYSVKRLLEFCGFQIETASNGPECIARLKEGFHGLILMDIVMPDMDGWDVVKAIVDLGLFEGNLICMLTGQEVPDVKMEYLKEYVLDYIRKPFDGRKLVQVVTEYLSYL
jgi:CheY-like chemotaxis protein